MVNPQVTRGGFDRPNLYLEVRGKKENFWTSIKPFVKHGRFPGSTIVYCLRKKEVEMVAKELQEQGVAVAMYHAGMGQAARKKSHKAFLCDEVEVVVATVAFGMGINKPDVRLVVNWGAPSDMEAYYQQVGVRCLRPLDILTIELFPGWSGRKRQAGVQMHPLLLPLRLLHPQVPHDGHRHRGAPAASNRPPSPIRTFPCLHRKVSKVGSP